MALIAATTGAVLGDAVFPTTTAGLSRVNAWIARLIDEHRQALAVVEATGSYGAILTDRLSRAGLKLVEAASMPGHDRRGTGKSDVIDAVRITGAVLGLEIIELRTPRTVSTNVARVALRALVVARDQMNGERTGRSTA